MSAPRTPPDLVQRSSFSSHDDGEITEFIRRMYADNRSRFAPVRTGARFSARTHDTPVIGADRVRTSIDYSGTSAEGFHDYVFFVVHAGSVQVAAPGAGTVASAGDVAFYPLAVPVEFTMRSFDVTTVRLPSDRVKRVAEDTTGMPAAQVQFLGITPVSAPMRRYWRSLAGLVNGALTDPDSPLNSPLLADDLARTVATAALHVFPNTTMNRQHVAGPGAVTPAAIRRAVAHIDAHAHLPLQLSEIAAAAGTSARVLQYGFRRHLGTTPLGYLRKARLELARRDLQAADPTRGDTRGGRRHPLGFRQQRPLRRGLSRGVRHPPRRDPARLTPGTRRRQGPGRAVARPTPGTRRRQGPGRAGTRPTPSPKLRPSQAGSSAIDARYVLSRAEVRSAEVTGPMTGRACGPAHR